jgi:serine/threonine-protein kinase
MISCPTSEQLQGLLADELAGDLAKELEAHVEECAACQRVLDELTKAGDLRRQGVRGSGEPSFLRELEQATLSTTLVGGLEVTPGASDPPRVGERYTVSRLHAEGGIGQVWLARDLELGREVALKELRSEYAGHPDAAARFLEEARITGQLEHPGIVPIYELVRRSEGKPFYTMRFIRGRTFAEAIKSYHAKRTTQVAGALDLRELLGSFVSVCNAVSYAHSRGVLHRDLKGNNIILGDYGEAIVLDWGLAKVVGGRDVCPTPPGSAAIDSVASPHRQETVQGDVLGTPQYMSPEQAQGRWDLVDERTDVYALGAVLYEILTGQSAFSGVDKREVLERVIAGAVVPPRQRVATTPAALDAVCLKALARAPGDRYPSAGELARDVQRWLADEPVTAWPEPWVVRARRWAARHRTAVSTAAAAVLVAAVSLAVATSLLAAANAREQEAKHEATLQRDAAIQQRDRADKNLVRARKAVEEYCTHVAADPRLRRGDFHNLRKQLLETAVPFYLDFVQQAANDLSAQKEQALAHHQLGLLRKAMGEKEEALGDCRQAAELFERLAGLDPNNAEYRRELARSKASMANVLDDLGRWQDAAVEFRKAVDLQSRLANDSPDVREYQVDLAKSRMGLGNVLAALGEWRQAEVEYRAGVDVQERLAGLSSVSEYRRDLARSRHNLARILAKLGKAQDAEAAYRRALSVQEQLVAGHPDAPEYSFELAGSRNSLGQLLENLGRRAEAAGEYRKAVDLDEQLARDFPRVPEYRQDLAIAHTNLGNTSDELGQQPEAAKQYRKAMTLQERLATEFPGVPNYRQDLARTRINLGLVLANIGRQDEGEKEYLGALHIYEKLAAEFPQARDYALELAVACTNYGNLLQSTGRSGAALSWFDKAIALDEPILQKEPRLSAARTGLLDARAGKAVSLAASGRHLDAAALASVLSREKDLDFDQLFSLAKAYSLASTKVQGNSKESGEYAGRAVQLLERARAAGYFGDAALVQKVRDDPDLAPLRAREDFRKLMARVQKESKRAAPWER